MGLLWAVEITQFAHNPKKTFRAANVTSLAQLMPEFRHTNIRIMAAHIPYQLQFRLGMLIRMAVRVPGLAG